MKLLDILPAQETWDVIDPSKLSTYMSCPRRYFYEYVLQWREDYVNNHLHFGSCWHLAVEHLLNNQYSKESLEEAQYIFYTSYRQKLGDETDGNFSPKDPQNALATLASYANRFKSDANEYQVLSTEIGGMVLLAPNSPMYFKIDALLQRYKDYKVICLDHKTSQRRMNFWQESWLLSTQMLTYLHVLYCLFGDLGSVGGIRVRCSFFYKSKPSEFDEAVVEKSHNQMQSWLASQTVWYNALKYDMEYLLNSEHTESQVMHSFPMNEKACFNYGRKCPYFDFCGAWANPLARCEQVPAWFRHEIWDPRTDSGAKQFIDLTTEQKQE